MQLHSPGIHTEIKAVWLYLNVPACLGFFFSFTLYFYAVSVEEFPSMNFPVVGFMVALLSCGTDPDMTLHFQEQPVSLLPLKM